MRKVLSIIVSLALAAGGLLVGQSSVQAAGDYRVSVSDVTDTEGAGTFTFKVGVTPAPTGTDSVKVDVTTVVPPAPAGTAKALTAATCPASGVNTGSQDFLEKTATGVTFDAANPTPKDFAVTICQDEKAEGTEFFNVLLDSASGNCTGVPCSIGIADGSGQGTILDDEPGVSISDFSQNEGNSGLVPFLFLLTSSQAPPAGCSIEVPFFSSDDTANAGSDYAATSGTFVIAPMTTTRSEIVNVFGDTLIEADESFRVTLGAPNLVGTCTGFPTPFVTKGVGVGTIKNDDGGASPSPSPGPLGPNEVSINDVNVNEGSTATFTVTRGTACPGGQTTTIPFDTRSFTTSAPAGTATEGSDYVRPAAGSSIQFTGIQTTQTISVQTVADVATEGSETFSVFLGTPSGTCATTIKDGEGVATILETGPTPTPGGVLISGEKKRVKERTGSRPCRVPVTLSRASAVPVTVQWRTEDKTAIAGSNYVAASGTITFPPGDTFERAEVTAISANGRRAAKFFVNLSNPTGGATIAKDRGSCLIRPRRR